MADVVELAPKPLLSDAEIEAIRVRSAADASRLTDALERGIVEVVGAVNTDLRTEVADLRERLTRLERLLAPKLEAGA